MVRTLNERMDDETKRALQKLDGNDLSDGQLAKAGRLVEDAYNFDAVDVSQNRC
ncbi:MAG: hypothetical protein U5N86_02205 [Planctomycetota bacterium]|nr:hypothetical protein [Planctomycetota bacterium]